MPSSADAFIALRVTKLNGCLGHVCVIYFVEVLQNLFLIWFVNLYG